MLDIYAYMRPEPLVSLGETSSIVLSLSLQRRQLTNEAPQGGLCFLDP